MIFKCFKDLWWPFLLLLDAQWRINRKAESVGEDNHQRPMGWSRPGALPLLKQQAKLAPIIIPYLPL